MTDAVALFYLADLSHAQIAARLGISVGAVKTRLHKARAALQARLADLRREPPAMPATVLMNVADVIPAEPLHILLLEEHDGARRLPIWIPAAEAVLEGGATVDARPSDAINLALVAGAPILVDETVLAQAADTEREIAEELARAIAQGPEDSPRT